ncbi:arabinosyltransferase domain-containing protein [soil metagenome]
MGRAASPDVVEDPNPSAKSSFVHRRWGALALLSACVAIVAAVVLPLAPIQMNQPVVSWPLDSSNPESTMLELTAQQPLGLDVVFSCRAARSAADSEGEIVVATIRPEQPALDELGLVVRATQSRLTADVSGRTVLDEALGSGECEYRLSLRPDRLMIWKDGDQIKAPQSVRLPQVDVLATSITDIPGGDERDLSVTVAVDDQFSTTPTALKRLLTILLVVAIATTLFLLAQRERTRNRRGAPSPVEAPEGPKPSVHRYIPRIADLVIVASLVLWMFIAPMTDDDGYYTAMARNSGSEGYVGNYYQLLNQSFTPFTWFYRLLGAWESLVGSSQVLLRIPALIAGLATWALLRRFTTRAQVFPESVRSSKWGPGIVATTLAVTFLAWWLPYDMGVRPEGIVALLSTAVLVLVQTALRTQSLLHVGLASALAGLSVVCHPTGFVALAPLLAALPSLWSFIRDDDRSTTLRNVVVVIAPAGLASAVAFADGSLRDFLHGQELFLSRFAQSHWYDELNRYGLLLATDPQGNFAKRAAVLLGLICLFWFALVVTASRSRGVRLSPALQLTGVSLALALILFWVTPSKWSHHFGSLAGLGPVFLTVFLISVPSVVLGLTAGKRLSRPMTLTIAFTAIVVFSLSFHGPNSWAYSWLLGVPYAGLSPRVGSFALESVPAWVIGYVIVSLIIWRWARRKSVSRRSAISVVTAPVMAVLFLLLSTGYLVGSFGVASLWTLDTYSPWANNLQDPLAANCDAAGAIDVLSEATARPLPLAPNPLPPPVSAPQPFVEQGGFFPPSPPPGGVGSAVASRVWGSLPAQGQESSVGTFSSPWFELPDQIDADEAVGMLATGRLDSGNELTVEYARVQAERVTVVDRQEITDSIDSPVWRSIPLKIDEATTAGASVMRLVATDATADAGGWLAFTGPSLQREVTLQEYIPADAAVALSWQFSFVFPCQRQPLLRNGITEPVEYGVVYGTEGTNGLNDNTWTIYAGGVFGPVTRVASTTLLPAQLRDAAYITTLQVYRFDNPYPTEAYELRNESRSLLGWQAPSW